jgi:hypothetical protein
VRFSTLSLLNQRSHPGAQNGHVSLQERRHQKSQRHAAIWFECGRRGRGKSRSGGARQGLPGYIRALRCGQRDVAQRVLKEHKKVEEQQTNITQLKSKMAKQEAIIAQQQKGMKVLTAQLKEQAAQIQR